MPSVYDLKPAFQSVLRPSVHLLSRCGVTANQVTVAAMILSIGQGLYLAVAADPFWPLALMPFVLLVRMALNAVDGMLAREFGQKSCLGAVLNEVGDVVSDAVLYLPLALLPAVDPLPLVLFVVVAVISEFAGVVALQVGVDRRYDGPFGKSDRAFWVGLLSVLLASGLLAPSVVGYVGWIFVVFSVLTVIHRTRRALQIQETNLPPTSDAAVQV